LARADWVGKAEAGYVMARGNTETKTANAKLDLVNEKRIWKHFLSMGGLYGRSNDVTSAQRWDLYWRSDYSRSERFFTFGALRYEEDIFNGFDYQGTLSAGFGYHFIQTDATQFTGTLGGGYRRLRTEDLIQDEFGNVVQRIKGERSEDGVVNAGIDYKHKLTDNTTLIDKLLVEAGPENTYANNELAIQVSMTSTLALSVAYAVRHNTDPPTGLEKTDQLTTVNLVYAIK
jgi:putative salt-induced outer membrane protein